MLDGLLEKKLSRLKNKDILVVMDDGLGFLGKLEDYDKNTLILKKVLQSQFEDIDWKDISPGARKRRSENQGEQRAGFVNWTKVNLEEVYVRTDHVSRIWPWIKKEKIPEHADVEEHDRTRPIYYEKEYL